MRLNLAALVPTSLIALGLTSPSPVFGQPQPTVVAADNATPREFDWAQEFPITPAFADWSTVVKLTDDQGREVAEMWLHRDSLSWRSSRAEPLLWVDVLVRVTVSGKYSRGKLVLACDATRIYATHALGEVRIGAGGAIIPVSKLIGVDGYKVMITGPSTWYDLLCFDRAFQAAHMARQ